MTKKPTLVKMWAYSQTEATVWCDNPSQVLRQLKKMDGISQANKRDGNKLYVEFDPRFDLDEIIKKVELL